MATDSSASESEKYWQRRYEDDFTLEGSGYKGLGQDFNKWGYRAQGRAFMKAIGPFLQDGSERVLDVGSGTGFFVERWRELRVRAIVGSDIAVKPVETLAARYPDVRFVQLDIGRDDVSELEGEFDIVSALAVVFHITNDAAYEEAFRNIYSLLKPGGILIFSENFLRAEPFDHGYQAGRLETDIQRVVQQAGFEIIKRRPMSFLMNGPARSKSRLLHWWWTRLTKLLLRSDVARRLAGPCLYPAELILVSLARRGPSTELMVCRKPDQPEAS